MDSKKEIMKNINKYLGALLLFFGSLFNANGDIIVLDHPLKAPFKGATFIELPGKPIDFELIEGNKTLYKAKIAGNVLKIQAVKPNVATDSLVITYIVHPGAEKEVCNTIKGKVIYSQEDAVYDLRHIGMIKEEDQTRKQERAPHSTLSPHLKQAIQELATAKRQYKRLWDKKDKIGCQIINMVSTGEEIILKVLFVNQSPSNYEIGEMKFQINNEAKPLIPIIDQPENLTVAAGTHAYMTFVIEHKIGKNGILAAFEEPTGRLNLLVEVPRRTLNNIKHSHTNGSRK